VSYVANTLSRKRMLAYFLMLGLIAKHIMSNEYGPLDRILEFLVFALIAYEVVAGIVRGLRERKRAKIVCERSEKIRQIVAKGQELQSDTPRFGTNMMAIAAWTNSVKEWLLSAQELMGSYSPQAVVALSHDTSGEVPPWWDSIAVAARIQYGTLIASLNNLQRILEKPEVYF
jgi:hypothetical protein